MVQLKALPYVGCCSLAHRGTSNHCVWLHTDLTVALWCPTAHPAWTRLILAVSSATAWASALPSLVGFHPSSMGHMTEKSVWLAVRRAPPALSILTIRRRWKVSAASRGVWPHLQDRHERMG